MKKTMVICAAILVCWSILAGQSALTVSPAGLLSACPTPSAKALIFCNVAGDSGNPDGAYVSANGAAYFKVGASAGGGGVTSYNGRTGAVTPQSNDYSYSQLSGKPTTLACTTASHNNGGFSASGCTIQ